MYIGVDIGGTGVQAGIVDNSGNILYKNEIKTDIDGGFIKIIDDIRILIDNLLSENNLNYSDIESIGFGVPSFINKDGLVTCVNLGWYEVEFIKTLENKFSETKIFAQNDATVAGIAESMFGSMKNKEIAVMYTLGTGVGGAIIINNKIFTGAHNMASEIGHTIIGENYFDCNCGNNGCVETFCSATSVIDYAKKLIDEGNKSILLNLANENLNNIDAKMIFDAYRKNDFVAISTINRFKTYLAKALAGMINTLDPNVICIGGGMSRSEDIILDGLEDTIRNYILYKKEDFAQITIAKLGTDAGIIGAAFLSKY